MTPEYKWSIQRHLTHRVSFEWFNMKSSFCLLLLLLGLAVVIARAEVATNADDQAVDVAFETVDASEDTGSFNLTPEEIKSLINDDSVSISC